MNKKITTFFIGEEELRKIRSILALEGKSVSAWIREKIDEKIAETEKTLK